MRISEKKLMLIKDVLSIFVFLECLFLLSNLLISAIILNKMKNVLFFS